MKAFLVTAIGVVCVCLASSGAVDAATADTSFPRCGWIKADNSASGVRVAQIDHCCVGTRRCPPPNENLTECAFACNTMIDSCTGILIRGGFPHVAFDGYTPDDCITFILSTPWCVACP